MPGSGSAPEGAEEEKFTVDLDKLLADVDFRKALKSALVQYGEAGGDIDYEEVNIVVIVHQDRVIGNGSCSIDLEQFQVGEVVEGGAEA